MKATHYIVYHKQGEDDGIVLDGFKCMFKGTKEEMIKVYYKYLKKAEKLIRLGDATRLRENADEDGTLSFNFRRNGNIIKLFFCDHKRAAFLLA